MTTEYEGILEVDESRGVIYFHCSKTGGTLLRTKGIVVPKEPLSALKGIMIDYIAPPKKEEA